MPPSLEPRRRFVLDSPTGAALTVRARNPDTAPEAVVLVFHGLAEHSARYDRLMGELGTLGFATYAHDHRGHGSTTAQDAPLRRFGSRNGLRKVVRDCQAVRELAQREHPGLPLFVLGHSMGGAIALHYARRFAGGLSGCLVWNAGLRFGWQERLGVASLRVEKMLKGSDVASQAFARATTDAWAKRIANRRTDVDWLSHDPDVVDAYIADPLCGWTPTVSLAQDIVQLARENANHEALSQIPHDLPIHCFGGSQDLATQCGAEVVRLAERLREAGSREVECEIVQGARHETLNEIEPYRGQAMRALESFLRRHLDRVPAAAPAVEPD
ncbi:alpha/beta hydrolase [Aureimonas flava]|uniref:Alpha/beta hydrolase n=1 Tax=Aureimonas flava TaxID=2320271 RepID=A0A3A1WQL7_9HYPH|nr:alpha/beta hydrolase [Aureimonas flava]RIY03354.1 alpha/beta hydrolase [Aureimonas flava]